MTNRLSLSFHHSLDHVVNIPQVKAARLTKLLGCAFMLSVQLDASKNIIYLTRYLPVSLLGVPDTVVGSLLTNFSLHADQYQRTIYILV